MYICVYREEKPTGGLYMGPGPRAHYVLVRTDFGALGASEPSEPPPVPRSAGPPGRTLG